MPLLLAALLVIAIHLSTNVAAWLRVGLLADDRFMVYAGFYAAQLSWPQVLDLAFLPQLPADAAIALYRPFSTLPYVFEFPWFGTEAMGYHAVNSLVHCTTALLWYSCWRALTGSAVSALAAAALFAGFPAHGEATHWIAARTNLTSALGIVAAVRCWLAAEQRQAPALVPLRWLAAAAVVLALGCKESAVVALPLLWLLSWIQAPAASLRARMLHALRSNALPLAAAAAWLCWRAFALGTFGIGTASPWQLDVRSPLAWLSALGGWLRMVGAPAHRDFAFPLQGPVLWLVHGALLLSALRGLREVPLRRALSFSCLGALCCMVAIAGLKCDLQLLTDSRYCYETALCCCGVLGLGIGLLPDRLRWPAFAVTLGLHALALHHNRTSWLRAGDVAAAFERDLHGEAGRGVSRVVDVPAIYHGAFVHLVQNPFFAVPPFATSGPAVVLGENDWQTTLRDLAADVAAGRDLATTRVVAHATGRLLPLPVPVGPQTVLPALTVLLARQGRTMPSPQSDLFVDVLAQGDRPWTCHALVRGAGQEWRSPVQRSSGTEAPEALRLTVPLGDAKLPDAPLTVRLVLQQDDQTVELGLGEVAAGPR